MSPLRSFRRLSITDFRSRIRSSKCHPARASSTSRLSSYRGWARSYQFARLSSNSQTDENGADDVVLVYGYHVADWTFTWSGLNTFGLLLNLDAGTVRLSCNGVRGPEKELGGQWQKGVAITLGDNLPDTQFYPEHDDEGVLPDDKSGGRAYSSKLAFSVPEAIPAFLSAGGFAVDLAEYDCRNAGCSYCADQEAVAAAEQDAEAEANA